MSGGKPAAVFSLQLEADGLLLGSDDVLPGSGLLLHTLLPLDLREGRLANGNVIKEKYDERFTLARQASISSCLIALKAASSSSSCLFKLKWKGGS